MTAVRRHTIIFALALLGLFHSGTPARAQDSPPVAIDTADWTGTDDLGRTLPTYAQTGPPKPDRWVGLFYWQWHGPDRWGPDYNITQFLKTHPGFRDFQAFPPGGPPHPTWYWAEPLFGYYASTDPWVIRKHLVLFADAGVDFLFLDYTNGSLYDPELKQLLTVAEDLKSKGVAVPKLVFFLNYEPEWKIARLYHEWYAPGKYDDLWFHWQGKPLMMAPMPNDATKFKDPADAPLLSTIQNYFTWRPTWAFQDAAKEPTKWRFMDGLDHPGGQRPALGPDGKIEQTVVSKSLGGPINDAMTHGGVSGIPTYTPHYNSQWLTPDSAKGLFFQAEWNNVFKNPAPILLVTGWNEWKASVWETPGVPMLGRVTQKGQGHIVDEFNMEFNRDLEPMKGGYGDDYFWQFFANMRRYKGMTPPPPTSAPRAIRLGGPISQWDGVSPVYHDALGDIADRDWDGATPQSHYTDISARNDITLAQVARDSGHVYFHARTADPLSPVTDKNWMLLFVNSDQNAKTGWHGFDLLIDRRRAGGQCTVERYAGRANVWRWRTVAQVPYRASGPDLQIALPRALLSPARGPLHFDFKWADNLPSSPSVMDFYSAGDTAPDARFSYRYDERAAKAPQKPRSSPRSKRPSGGRGDRPRTRHA